MKHWNVLAASVVATLSFIATGCAGGPTPFPLRADTGASAAQVRFTNEAEHAWMDLYPPDDCNKGVMIAVDNPVANFIASTKGEAPRRIGMIDSPAPTLKKSAEYAVGGGQVINIGISGARKCLGGRSFLAESGEQYEVVLRQNPQDECFVAISKLSLKDGMPWRTPVKNVGGLICKPPY